MAYRRNADKNRAWSEIVNVYHFHILEAHLSLSASTSPISGGGPEDPHVYSEIHNLQLHGVVHHPEVISGRDVDLTVYGSHELQEQLGMHEAKRREKKGIGFVNFWGKQNSASVWLSPDMVSVLYEHAQQQPMDIVLMGDAMKRRSAPIRHFHFGTNFNQGDWY